MYTCRVYLEAKCTTERMRTRKMRETYQTVKTLALLYSLLIHKTAQFMD